MSTQRGFVMLGVLVAGVLAVAQASDGASTPAPAASASAAAASAAVPAASAAASAAKPAASAAASAAPAVVANAVTGKETFTEYCSVCHGVGAKGFIGPHIAGVNWGTSGLQTIVRTGIGGYGSMPAFNADAVSDKDIANIVAYLKTLPPNVVPLAQHGSVVTGDLANGKTLYAANCASCHGAAGQGGVGPELHGENTRKDTAGTIFWIKHPILPMPTLYPKPLSEKDVDDVAAYVETL